MDACLKKSLLNGGFMDASFPHDVHRCQNLRGAVYSTTVPFLHCQATSTPTTSTGSGSPPTVRKVQLMDHVIAGGGRTACTCCPGSPVLMTNDQWPLWPIFNHNFTQSCGLFTSKTPGNFSSWKVVPTPSLIMFCFDNDAREFHNLNMNGKHAQFRLINKHRQDYQCSNDFSLSRIKEHPKMDHPSRLTFKGLSVTSLCLVTPCDGERAAW